MSNGAKSHDHEGPKSDPEPKSKGNPLGAIGRKPGSYVGDLDSLLAEVGNDEPEATKSAPRTSEQQSAGGLERRTERGKPRMKRINLDVPVELHRQFKGVAGSEGRTMTEVLQELIGEYVAGKGR